MRRSSQGHDWRAEFASPGGDAIRRYLDGDLPSGRSRRTPDSAWRPRAAGYGCVDKPPFHASAACGGTVHGAHRGAWCPRSSVQRREVCFRSTRRPTPPPPVGSATYWAVAPIGRASHPVWQSHWGADRSPSRQGSGGEATPPLPSPSAPLRQSSNQDPSAVSYGGNQTYGDSSAAAGGNPVMSILQLRNELSDRDLQACGCPPTAATGLAFTSACQRCGAKPTDALSRFPRAPRAPHSCWNSGLSVPGKWQTTRTT